MLVFGFGGFQRMFGDFRRYPGWEDAVTVEETPVDGIILLLNLRHQCADACLTSQFGHGTLVLIPFCFSQDRRNLRYRHELSYVVWRARRLFSPIYSN